MLGERGDTIIEVLIAFAVFATIAVIGLSTMNQGTSSAQQSLERVHVKQQIDIQAELLRAIHKQDGSAWQAIKIASFTTTPPPTITTQCPATAGLANTFALAEDRDESPIAVVRLTPISINNAGAPPYAQLKYPASPAAAQPYGIWIQKTDKGSGTFDFTIKACWYGPGARRPLQMQTVVRLYDT